LIKLSISPLYVLIGAPSIRCADIAEAAIMFPCMAGSGRRVP
jgi:hypothetical protein